MEVGQDPGDEGNVWRQMLGDAQQPWPVMLEKGN